MKKATSTGLYVYTLFLWRYEKGKAKLKRKKQICELQMLGRCPGEENGNPLQYSCQEIPWTEEPGRLQFIGLQRGRQDWAIDTFTHDCGRCYLHWHGFRGLMMIFVTSLLVVVVLYDCWWLLYDSLYNWYMTVWLPNS